MPDTASEIDWRSSDVMAVKSTGVGVGAAVGGTAVGAASSPPQLITKIVAKSLLTIFGIC